LAAPTRPARFERPQVLTGAADRRSRRTSWPWNYYSRLPLFPRSWQEAAMNGIIYLIGLIVVILAILSFFGLR
jgi:predicted membrane channel-forming protein YqfA (hemolysin III family)